MARDLKLEVVLAAIDKATKPIRAITQGSSGLARQMREGQDALKGLNKQQGDIRAYRTANIAVVKQARSIRDLETKSRGYSQSLEEQRTRHVNLRANLKTAQSQYNKLAKAMMNGKGGSAEFQRELQKAQIGLKSNQQAFERSSSSIKTYRERLRSTDDRLGRLNQQHKATQERLGGLKTRLNEAGIGTEGLGNKSRKMRTEQERLNATLDQQRQKLAAVTKQQQRMAAARDRYQKSQQLAGSMAASGAAGLAAGSGVLYAGARMMAPGLEYGAQMSELQAVARLGKDDPRMQMLKEQARGLGATTAFSATEVGAGQTFLARAGFTPEAINSSMQDILDLALANGADLARTADIASNISSAFKIDPEVEGNITRVADVLSGTAARSNVNLESLGDTMKYLGGAEDLGLSLEQAATMAGLMGNIGIQGSQAGTAMRAMMNRLTGPAAKGRKAMESLGLQVEDATGKMRSMPDILRDLNSATKDMGNVQRKSLLTDIFGAEAGSGMAELVGQMSGGGLDDLLDQLHNVAGENARMAATRSDNIAGDIKGLQSAWEEIGIGLSDTNEGPLRELITSLTGVVRSVGEWMKENPELVATIAKVVAVTAALVAIGGAIAVTLASILGPLAMIKYGFAMASVAVSAFSWPLLAIIAAIALVGVAAYMLWKNWDGVIGGLKALWSDLANSARAIWERLIGFFKGIWTTIKTAFAGGIAGVAALLINWSPLGLLYKAFAGVMRWLGVDMPNNFTEFGGNLISALVNGIRAMLGTVLGVFSSMWSGIKTAFGGGILGVSQLIINWSPLGLFYKAFAGVLGWFGVELPGKFTEFGGNLISALVNGIKAMFGGLLELFTGAWAEIKTAFDGGLLGVSQLIINWSPLGLFYKAFAGVLGWFGVELPGKFTEFGGMLMSGMVSGITAGLGKVKDAITGAGDQAIGWFKEKLGIRSPSRVFAALGDDTMHGLQAGLDRSQNGPLASLTKATKALVGAGALTLGITAAPAVADQVPPQHPPELAQHLRFVSDALPAQQPQPLQQQIQQQVHQVLATTAAPELPELVQRVRVVIDVPAGLTDIVAREDISIDSRPPLTMAPAPVAAAPTYNISISVQSQPGMDEAQLARLVAQELQKATREQEARRRSSLYDND